MNPDSRKSVPPIFDDKFGTGQMYITFRNYKINKGEQNGISYRIYYTFTAYYGAGA